LKVEQKNFFDSTFLTAGCSITGMNTSSSQTELAQSWGLGHSSRMTQLKIGSLLKLSGKIKYFDIPNRHMKWENEVTSYR